MTAERTEATVEPITVEEHMQIAEMLSMAPVSLDGETVMVVRDNEHIRALSQLGQLHLGLAAMKMQVAEMKAEMDLLMQPSKDVGELLGGGDD